MDVDRQRKRDIHRSRSNPMICQTAKHFRPVSRLTLQSLRFSLSSGRSIFLSGALFASYVLSVFSNIEAYSRMPIRRSLPDVISDAWSDFALWHSARFHSSISISRIVTGLLFVFSFFYTYHCFNVCNIRKYVVILIIALFFRSLALVVTQIPPPCHGFPNCVCSQTPYAELRKRFPVWKVAFVYFGTFGYGSGEIPCCGDLMMSGQAVMHVVLGLYLIDTMGLLLSPSKLAAVRFTVVVMITVASAYSVLIRAEYTISIVLSVVFVLLEEWLYQIGQTMCQFAYGPFLMTRFGQVFLWLEKEMDESEDEADVQGTVAWEGEKNGSLEVAVA
jgi:hypothetical protein